jgi:Protein of unknown function (DUF3485)
MNRQMTIFSLAALVLMTAAAVMLSHIGHFQTLSPPGVKTHPLDSSIRVEADLPEHVLNYDSKLMDTEPVVLATLPADTSFGYRRYQAPDKFWLDLRVVLMGHDRTSMHKPQICLNGHGWRLNDTASEVTSLKVEQPHPYDLPVVKLVASNTVTVDGQKQTFNAVYVYWYVANDAVSASETGLQRMWLMAKRLLRTGVLQRWAYVSCLAPCVPGQEAATYDRLKQFIVAAAPQFQLYPPPESGTVAAAR